MRVEEVEYKFRIPYFKSGKFSTVLYSGGNNFVNTLMQDRTNIEEIVRKLSFFRFSNQGAKRFVFEETKFTDLRDFFEC